MKVQKQTRPAKLTPDVLKALQEAMSDVIKPDYNKEHNRDATKKKRRNKNNKNKEK